MNDRAAIDRAIEGVLARQEFQPAQLSWWDQLKQWFWEKLFGGVMRAIRWIDLDTPLGKAIFVFLILSLVAIVAHLVWTIVQALPKRGARRDGAVPAPAAGLAPEPAALAARARELAAAGRFEEAMHALYRATLLHLDDRRLACFEEHKTAGDYVLELTAAEPRRHFRALVGAFDPVAWGGRDAGGNEWEGMRTAAAQLGVAA